MHKYHIREIHLLFGGSSFLLLSCLSFPFLAFLLGLHSHHIPPAALDRPTAGVRRQQELHSRCPSCGVPLGTGHLHCGVQEVLPPWSHGGKQAHPPLLQWYGPVCTQVSKHLGPWGWRKRHIYPGYFRPVPKGWSEPPFITNSSVLNPHNRSEGLLSV